eukprot:7405213-Ditylum_brightwellii.AAC.1
MAETIGSAVCGQLHVAVGTLLLNGAMANHFSFDQVFLVFEGEAAEGEVKCGKCVEGDHCSIEGHASNKELEMFKEEWGGLGLVATETIFAWPKQEEEGKPNEVGDGLCLAVSVSTELVVVVGDVHGYGADTVGGRMISSEVRSPYTGKDLSDGAKILFHAEFTYAASALSQLAISGVVSKDLEDWDRIGENAQVGWDLQPVAEEAPLVPVGGVGAHSGADHTVVHRLLCMLVQELPRFLLGEARVEKSKEVSGHKVRVTGGAVSKCVLVAG